MILNSTRQDEMYQIEETIQTCVERLRGVKEEESKEKIDRRIKHLRLSVEFVRKEFPKSKYGNLENVPNGGEVARHFELNDLV